MGSLRRVAAKQVACPAPSVSSGRGARLPIITLCGSTRFLDEFDRINRELTLKGNVVLSVGAKAHHGFGDVSKSKKELLDRIHREKIDLSDEIFVINKNGYIGPSTSAEIRYAKKHKKRISYLEPLLIRGGRRE